MANAVKLFRDQSFSALKRDCIQGRTLFEDPCFPANTESLFYTGSAPGEIEWRRPQELCESPRLFVDGISSHDLNQGELGNCWFLAAASCIATRDGLWQKVIPDWREQDWDPKRPEKYGGIFCFRFWRFTEWTEVVVDDRLPTMGGDLLYCHSTSRQEFWSALLEKAYAKLSGCYEALSGGNVGDALLDFTGAVVETLDVKPEDSVETSGEGFKLGDHLLTTFDQGGLISCSSHVRLSLFLSFSTPSPSLASDTLSPAPPHGEWDHVSSLCVWGCVYVCVCMCGWWGGGLEMKQDSLSLSLSLGLPGVCVCVCQLKPSAEMQDLGLNTQHSYSVTGLRRVPLTAGTLAGSGPGPDTQLMVRMRNPWGNSEWIGPWSDASKEWNKVSKHERKKMGIVVRNDGEFWMTFDDWCKYFTKVIICFLVNTSRLSLRKTWEQAMFGGAWTRHTNPLLHRAGGCTNHIETFLHNPQCLQQKEQRIHRREGKGEMLMIGFSIFRVERNREYRLHTYPERVEGSRYADTRSVFLRTVLSAGRYLIIPTTFLADIEAPFLLRVFTDTVSGCRELTLDKPKVTCWNIMYRYPRMATHVHLHGAMDLLKQRTSGGADPYAVIKCEFGRVRTAVFEDTLNPQFDTKAIFYRRNPKFPVIIQVWDRNIFWDRLLGEITLEAAPSDTAQRQVLELQRKDKRGGGGEAPSRIEVTITSSLDLMTL
eukprot:gi/632936241/ref/XP_007893117.1/ PREDICTED: calpain-6 [Callorhinchus milii]